MTDVTIKGAIVTTLAALTSRMYEGAGTYTLTLPSTLVGGGVWVDAAAPGGGGGAGQASGTTAGGGGGTAGQSVDGYFLSASPGDTLTITIGAQGAGGVVGGAVATAGGNITITGATTSNATASPFPTVLGGSLGAPGAAGTGGTGGTGRGSGAGSGGAAGANGASVTTMYGRVISSAGGGGGASTAGSGGAGGGSPNWANAAGGGSSGGGGGGGGWWGQAFAGSANGVDANQSPAFVGWGQGGAGGGANGKGGPGGPGMVRLKYYA
ncbi:hypothetical protein [Bradyrhizobium sp. 188]|uniref:hypothetical protein n=1 Tax=Bradyrhizobium sp. 188 TaxID=2782656 RepID=UPI001FFB73C6|nr:hypothetical protein [Bradyrhizobium sp. 188]MCK1503115.1 hypothetical protein [Bradyrhizobium sp. 188]